MSEKEGTLDSKRIELLVKFRCERKQNDILLKPHSIIGSLRNIDVCGDKFEDKNQRSKPTILAAPLLLIEPC